MGNTAWRNLRHFYQTKEMFPLIYFDSLVCSVSLVSMYLCNVGGFDQISSVLGYPRWVGPVSISALICQCDG